MVAKKDAAAEATPENTDKIPPPTDTMAIWDKLKTTDPKHTKAFTRAGGFSGTAIKPVYVDEKMTRLFGPVGIGWGTSKPEFDVRLTETGVSLVFCTVYCWYVINGVRSQPVYGCGGDVLMKHGKNPHDDAFKAAFTDAVGNALKYLGMSADVHMGQFEDSKYVEQASNAADDAARKEQLHTDQEVARVILEDVSSCASNAGIDLLLATYAAKIRLLGETNPGVLTKLKADVSRFRTSHADYDAWITSVKKRDTAK